VKYVFSRVKTFLFLSVLLAVCWNNFFFHGSRALLGLASSWLRFRDHTQTHHTHSVGLLGPSHRALSDNTQHSQTDHQCHRALVVWCNTYSGQKQLTVRESPLTKPVQTTWTLVRMDPCAPKHCRAHWFVNKLGYTRVLCICWTAHT
jgi:hypothetical protein